MKTTVMTLQGMLFGLLLTVLALPALGRSMEKNPTDTNADPRLAEARELVSLVRRHHPIHQWLPVFLRHAHNGPDGERTADSRALKSAYGGKGFDKSLEEHLLGVWDERNMAEVMAFMRSPQAWHRAAVHREYFAGRLNEARLLYQTGPIFRTAEGIHKIFAGTEGWDATGPGRISNRLQVSLFVSMLAGHRNQAPELLHARAQFYGTPVGRWFAQVLADGFLSHFRDTTRTLASAGRAAGPA